MNLIDIIVIIVLLGCLWSGWRSGILVQLSGIVGIVLGAWVAYKFAHSIGGWLDFRELPTEVLFVVVLLAVMVCVIILARIITGLFRAGGLAAPLRVLGALFGVAKGLLIMGLLLLAVEAVLPLGGMIPGNGEYKKGLPEMVREAKSHKVIRSVGEFVFPYVSEGTRRLMREFRDNNEGGDNDQQTVEPTEISSSFSLDSSLSEV